MMQPLLRWWFPVPFAVMQSTEARVLPIGAVEVFLAVVAEGHKRGTPRVPYVNHHDGFGTIGSIVMREGHAGGGESVRPLVQSLVDLGWLALDNDARCIRITRDATLDGTAAEPCAAVGPATPPTPRNEAVPSSAPPSPADATTGSAPRVQRGTKTRAQVMSTLRSARSYFERRFDPNVKRRRPYGFAPVGITWEQWCGTEEGRTWLDAIGATEHGVAPAAHSRATTGRNGGNGETVAVAGNAAEPEPGNAAETVADTGNASTGNGGNVAESVASSVADVPGNGLAALPAALPTLATPLPSHTLPSEREEKKRTHTESVRVGAHERGNGNALGNGGNGNALGNGGSGNAPTLKDAAGWRQSHSPIKGMDFRSICEQRLDKRRVSLPPLVALDDFELALERASDIWSQSHQREVTRQDWLDFIEWLRVGGSSGEGGLWFPGRHSPVNLGSFTRDAQKLAVHFEAAMTWRDERRVQADAEAKARAAQKQTFTATHGDPLPPPLTPEAIRAMAAAAGIKTAIKKGPHGQQSR